MSAELVWLLCLANLHKFAQNASLEKLLNYCLCREFNYQKYADDSVHWQTIAIIPRTYHTKRQNCIIII